MKPSDPHTDRGTSSAAPCPHFLALLIFSSAQTPIHSFLWGKNGSINALEQSTPMMCRMHRNIFFYRQFGLGLRVSGRAGCAQLPFLGVLRPPAGPRGPLAGDLHRRRHRLRPPRPRQHRHHLRRCTQRPCLVGARCAMVNFALRLLVPNAPSRPLFCATPSSISHSKVVTLQTHIQMPHVRYIDSTTTQAAPPPPRPSQ